MCHTISERRLNFLFKNVWHILVAQKLCSRQPISWGILWQPPPWNLAYRKHLFHWWFGHFLTIFFHKSRCQSTWNSLPFMLKKIGYDHLCALHYTLIKWSPFGQFSSYEKNTDICRNGSEFPVEWHPVLLKKYSYKGPKLSIEKGARGPPDLPPKKVSLSQSFCGVAS